MKKGLSRTLITLFLLVFIVVGCGVSWMEFDLWRDLPGFQEVTGQVMSKSIDTSKRRTGRRTRTSTKHHVVVSYTPKGQNSAITHDTTVSSGVYGQLVEGKPVPVFYDPQDVERIVLMERSIGPLWMALAFPMLFVVIPLGVIFWLWRP